MPNPEKKYDSDSHWLADNVIADLVGGTIICPALTPVDEYGDQFAGFKIKLKSGEEKLVWVLRDPEGNGGGFLEVDDQ